MSGKVEFQLSLDDRKALEAIRNTQSRIEQTQRKLNEAGKDGKNAFDGVGDAVSKVAGVLGVAGGIGAAFQATLQQIQEQAAAINREAQKSLEIGKQAGAGAGRLMQNIPSMSDAELMQSQRGIANILLANPAQGENANLDMFDALTGVRSANPTLTNEQALAVVNEAAQSRMLDSRLPLADVAQGFGSLSAATGMDPNEVQNAAMRIQGQGFVTDLSSVLRGVSKLQPVAASTGTSPAESFGLFNFATKTLQDTQGDESVTAVASILSNLQTRAGDVEGVLGFRPEGSPLERLQQIVEAQRAGNISEDQLGELFPKISKGVAGRTLISSLFESGFGALQSEVDVFAGGLGGDMTADQIDRARRLVPGFNQDFNLRSQQTLANSARGLNMGGLDSAAVRNAMMEDMESRGLMDTTMELAGSRFDMAILAGKTPQRAYEVASMAEGLGSAPLFGKFASIVDSAVGFADGQNEAINPQNNVPVEELLEKLIEKQSEAVRKGMSEALRENKTREPIGENQ